MKAAPIIEEMAKHPRRFQPLLVHTGQHYDEKMSKIFFDDLRLPMPDLNLGIGSASHTQQTAQVMIAFEPVLIEYRPDLVVVVGDVNSTLACALVATKLHVPIAHVEAGLRSFDRAMPEEINRILTDQIADLLFTTERGANENLLREGIPEQRIHFVGNVMIDTLLRHKARALALNILEPIGLTPDDYVLLTLHRPSNVDVRKVLEGMLDALTEIQNTLPILFPAHPRTMKRIQEFGFEERLAAMPGLRLVEPLGYLEFLNLMANARLVLTDSGGIQEETTILGVPCLTLRKNTERPITVAQGTNTIVGSDPERIVSEALLVLNGKERKGQVPELWDGKAASRIVRIIDRAVEVS
jgi:UDP-N-acetylglucosamine 2-epimerase (non-hydrolysing)